MKSFPNVKGQLTLFGFKPKEDKKSKSAPKPMQKGASTSSTAKFEADISSTAKVDE